MCFFHKWCKVAESSKWRLLQCIKCGKMKYDKKFIGGYQPKPAQDDVNA